MTFRDFSGQFQPHGCDTLSQNLKYTFSENVGLFITNIAIE